MQTARVGGSTVDLAIYQIGVGGGASSVELVWGHGWGCSHAQFLTLAESVTHIGPSLLIDFPGFGASPAPPGTWGTIDYADAVAAWLSERPRTRRIWVGHSFGGRVGLRLAARHPALLDGLFLIASAGLRPRRTMIDRAKLGARVWAYKVARATLPEGRGREWLRARFGSADYARAGPLRPILVNVVGEDLSEAARAVGCPVALLYGDRDRETPPEIGDRLRALIPHAKLYVLRGYGHHDILTEGRHQVLHRLTQFAQGVVQQ